MSNKKSHQPPSTRHHDRNVTEIQIPQQAALHRQSNAKRMGTCVFNQNFFDVSELLSNFALKFGESL